MFIFTRRSTALAAILAAVGAAAANMAAMAGVPSLPSGVDLKARDTHVRPGDDFFQFALGSWYAGAQIPPDQSEVGVDSEVSARVGEQLRGLIASSALHSDNPQTALVGDLFASFMDGSRVEHLDAAPLRADLDRIARIANRTEFLILMGSAPRDFGASLFSLRAAPDAKEPVNVLYIGQAGLGLNDPDDYVSASSTRRKAYGEYIARTLHLVDYSAPKSNAAAVIALETQLARVSWSQTQRRDIAATYNPTTLSELQRIAPGVSWKTFMAASGVSDTAPLVLAEKSAVLAIADIYAHAEIGTLKAWETFHTVDNASRFLSRRFVDNRFAFHGKVLTGAKALPARGKRGVNLVDAQLGSVLGRLYVTANFSAEAKQQMEGLVERLRAAMAQRISSLGWMSDSTKHQALAKLAAMRVFVGYPSRWRDYTGLELDRSDLYGNIKRSMALEWSFRCASLGKPIDKDAWGPLDWGITPQTVDAFNIASENLVIFPAAFLQPPFFNPKADAAHNYGAIGAVIGHEIVHGFDDQGRKLDAIGKLRDWWSAADNQHFEQRAAQLARQYDAIEVSPGLRVNGSQTLGEDIADLGGLLLALDAYHSQLGSAAAPVIDGLSGDQRLFFGWAQRWRRKVHDDALRDQISMDVHAPAAVRTNATLRNIDDWYNAFNIQPQDKNYLRPADRVRIW